MAEFLESIVAQQIINKTLPCMRSLAKKQAIEEESLNLERTQDLLTVTNVFT